MRHFDAWILRDPYSIFHYYSTGHRWKETVRDLIQARKICAPLSLNNGPSTSSPPVDLYSEEHPMNPQSTSAFLTKLPIEVRLTIYEYAFGDQVVHLVQVKDKIRHVRCTNTTSSLDKNRRCCPMTPARWRPNDLAAASTALATGNNANACTSMLYPHTHPLLPSNLSNSPTTLLRTCRFIYAEACSILYKSSTFDVDDLTTFIAFSLSISPDHLRAIKKLTIQWTPVWQPMAGEELKSSIYSHTHNDRLWVLFWTRVAALNGLEELALSVDLGLFAAPGANTPHGAGSGNGGALIGGNRLRLSINEPWVAPLLCVRGLRSFELGITAKCDAAAKQFLEGDLVRDAMMLRDHLRLVMCTERGADLPVLPGSQAPGLFVQLELLKRCAEEVEADHQSMRPRLAITAGAA
ncbi:uncharacterized protein DSM5745_06248 [Aspergillus mulundensis]|uniref:DUF7730 domain-containing protein n=1 Tax=Aspergillus mulundensis TaxID=1810919 RepID=A0A3D8RQN6_9EURO|nr:Uncharacterized protein DSM5745_06248 [Aspergillus mulundensis]RDW76256.1 Uncharacterized protein DSM5745_06248 [Aspergillus mulundensis]